MKSVVLLADYLLTTHIIETVRERMHRQFCSELKGTFEDNSVQFLFFVKNKKDAFTAETIGI